MLDTAPQTMIELRHVDKWYGEFQVLKDISLTVTKGERVVICGPSGSGKSTVIRCINRLEEHQKGQILVEGVELNADSKNIDHVRRGARVRLSRMLKCGNRLNCWNTMCGARWAWCSSSSTCSRT
jgi:ABC-type histidine transport system ATPase subunit